MLINRRMRHQQKKETQIMATKNGAYYRADNEPTVVPFCDECADNKTINEDYSYREPIPEGYDEICCNCGDTIK